MIICPACRTAHVQGTLFCEQCGGSLIGVVPVDESAAVMPALAPAARPVEPSLPVRRPDLAPLSTNGSGLGAPLAERDAEENPDLLVAEDAPSTMLLATVQDRDTGRLAIGSVPTRVRVLVLNTGRLTDWIEDPVIHVGRTDRSANVFPTIDLETDGGHNAGVSRRHVRISRQLDGYYLEDLGSINGTFLNRRRLSPGSSAELKDGDEVRLGNIVLRVVLGGFQRSQ